MTISSILLSCHLTYSNSIDFTNLFDMRTSPFYIPSLIIPLLILISCSEYSKPPGYPFPPEDSSFPFVMHRINPIGGDTISSRVLESFMFDDGLFLNSDHGLFEVERIPHVKDTSASSIEIFISDQPDRRVIEITESYTTIEKGQAKSIISSQTLAVYQFKGTEISFPIVFDGIPSDFIIDCTVTTKDALEWTKEKYESNK